MTSARQTKANHSNARSSTGPKTASGKARAAQNARRHGLSVLVVSDPVLSRQVDSLAQEICGNSKDRELYQLAYNVAEAEIDLNRICRGRHNMLVREIADPRSEINFMTKKREKEIRREIGLRVWFPRQFLFSHVSYAPPQGPQKIAMILAGLAKQLKVLDRYERRARSRRKFAIRAFDLARRELDVQSPSQSP